MLKPGIWAIPIPFVEAVDDETRAYVGRRQAAVGILAGAWDRIIDEAETELGPQLFDPRNYPSSGRLAERFYVEHRWLDYGVPGRLQAIKSDIWTRERTKAEQEIANVKIEAIQTIRARALDLVGHIAERLTPAEDGKRRVFRDSMLGHVREFIELFPALNTAAGDAALSPLVERARRAIDGVDAQVLRDDELVRQGVANEFAAIRTALDGMVIERTRKITIENDDDGELPF